MISEKIIQDAAYIRRQMAIKLHESVHSCENANGIVLYTRYWAAFLRSDSYTLEFNGQRINISPNNAMAAKYLLCAIQSEIYNLASTIDVNKLRTQLDSKSFLTDFEFALLELFNWINIPYILLWEKMFGRYTLLTENAQIEFRSDRLVIVEDSGKRVQLPYPENYDFSTSKHLAFLHKLPKTEQKSKPKPVSESVKNDYSFKFTVKANVPITVQAESYAEAVKQAIKNISAKSLADTEYEIVNTAYEE